MNEKLWEHNRDPFSQAEGTPCTIRPLIKLLGFGGNTDWANDILEGTAEYPTVEDKSIIEILQEYKHLETLLLVLNN